MALLTAAPSTDWVSNASSFGNRAYYCGCNHHQYSLQLPMNGWRNWAGIGGLVK